MSAIDDLNNNKENDGIEKLINNYKFSKLLLYGENLNLIRFIVGNVLMANSIDEIKYILDNYKITPENIIKIKAIVQEDIPVDKIVKNTYISNYNNTRHLRIEKNGILGEPNDRIYETNIPFLLDGKENEDFIKNDFYSFIQGKEFKVKYIGKTNNPFDFFIRKNPIGRLMMTIQYLNLGSYKKEFEKTNNTRLELLKKL